MIVYLDTSALVKLYITEEFSDLVKSLIAKTKLVATQVISFVEACSTFARLHRENKITAEQHEQLKNIFIEDWENYFQIETSPLVLQRAANLSAAFSLRAYDSVHLSAADILASSTDEECLFACFDYKLNQAAEALKLKVLKK